MDGRLIVIVEDEDSARLGMERALKKKGHAVLSFAESPKALEYIKTNSGGIDLVITDLRMPELDGIRLIQEITKLADDISIILVTAFGSIESAVEAMKLGAEDYLSKPLDMFELRKRVEKIVGNKRLKREVSQLKQRLDKKYSFSSIIGNSPGMEKLFEKILMVAPTNSTVLITGESGTGKELIANAIHQNSPRKNAMFLPINCAAIPGEILESELFGHEKGSFTGAIGRKIGKFEMTTNGTLLLDEIGEMSMDLQAKLLRIIEQKEFMRVGGSDIIKVKTRILGSTNRNLDDLVREGRFREDLLFRLKVIHLTIPPLRERREDIPLLINHFLKLFSEEHGKDGLEISSDSIRLLCRYNWPGNVRELKNVMESLVIFAQNSTISLSELPEEIIGKVGSYGVRSGEIVESVLRNTEDSLLLKIGTPMADVERELILKTLEQCDGNRTVAARILGIGLRTLQRKLKEYGEAEIDENTAGH
ncbi:MAG: sigma-54-dependent Fis family transcriptional regulator [Acidobacteria bacterium]|nr:sigma-54-dependent Fis family transcriptional regulator [Acidobacteriota bacterium]